MAVDSRDSPSRAAKLVTSSRMLEEFASATMAAPRRRALSRVSVANAMEDCAVSVEAPSDAGTFSSEPDEFSTRLAGSNARSCQLKGSTLLATRHAAHLFFRCLPTHRIIRSMSIERRPFDLHDVRPPQSDAKTIAFMKQFGSMHRKSCPRTPQSWSF